MKRPRILIAESTDYSPKAIARLRAFGDLTLAHLSRAGLLSTVRDADVLWVRLAHRINEEVFAAGMNLKFLVTPTTGLNHIDLEAADRHGVHVLSLADSPEFLKTVHATAEHTIGLILALLRHLPSAAQHVLDGGWDRDLFRGSEIHGKTIGIVGYGRLGRMVARYLEPFGARLLAADPHMLREEVAPGVTLVPLERLLREADLVTLHVNLSARTEGFFGPRQFAQMRKGARLVNTSRGELVDEAALIEAIDSGRLRGAALDVLSDERATGMGDHPLVVRARRYSHVIITPHLGGCTAESMEKTELFMANRLEAEWSRPASQHPPEAPIDQTVESVLP